MPARYVHMPTENVIRAARDDFSAMATIATADALHGVRPDTRRWLRSREGHLLWLDALHAAEADHLVRAEAARYHRSPHAPALRCALDHIRLALREADAVRARHEREEREASREYQNQRDPHYVARAWLAQHHHTEYDTRLRRLTVAAGLPRHLTPPRHDPHDEIEYACHAGILAAPLTTTVRTLIGGPYRGICHATARDARDQHRTHALRHPLALRRWHTALDDLLRHTKDHALAPSIHALGDVGVRTLRRLGDDRAEHVLAARSFFAVVRQRHIEHHHARRALTRVIRERRHQRDRPWYDARDRARHEIAHHHPEQYRFIVRQLLAHVGAGDGTLLYAPTGRNNARRDVKTRIMTALADGTWHT